MDHIMNNRLSLEFGQTYARIPSLANDPFSTCRLRPTRGRSRSRSRCGCPGTMLYRQFGAGPGIRGLVDRCATVQVFRTDCLRELTKIKTA